MRQAHAVQSNNSDFGVACLFRHFEMGSHVSQAALKPSNNKGDSELLVLMNTVSCVPQHPVYTALVIQPGASRTPG